MFVSYRFLNIIVILISLSFITACKLEVPIKPKLEKLLSDGEIVNAYKTGTNHTIETTYFGINPMIASGNTLYLGLGSGLPAGTDGAVLAKFVEGDRSLSFIEILNEQGVMSFAQYGNGISVPGADPCCGDKHNDAGNPGRYDHQWDWGNYYYIDTSTQNVTKHRNLPNVVHGWGSWYDKTDQTLYYAGSGHLADTEIITDATTTGVLYKTTDFGATWTQVANRDDGIGLYRSYDVIGINNSLYVQFNDELSGSCGIARSDNKGQTWTRIPNSDVRCATRLYNIQNQLIALSPDGKAFIKISASNNISTHTFSPLFKISAYHTLSHDSSGNIYVGTVDGRVMHSKDLISWEEIARAEDTTVQFNTSVYWPEKKWLILSNWGEKANLWKLPVSD